MIEVLCLREIQVLSCVWVGGWGEAGGVEVIRQLTRVRSHFKSYTAEAIFLSVYSLEMLNSILMY